MELQAQLEQKQRRMAVRSEMCSALSKLAPDVQKDLLLELLAERTLGDPVSPLPTTPNSEHHEQTLSESFVAILAERPGLTIPEIAKLMYPGQATKQAKHNARSMLRYLKKRGKTRTARGKWYVAEKRLESDKRPGPGPNTIAGLVLQIVGESSKPVASGEILAGVHKAKASVDRRSVYAAVYQLINDGLLVATQTATGKVHSLPTGGGSA